MTASTAAASTAPGANPANPPPQSAPAEASQAEASPQEKLNLYIECYNHADSSFRRSLARYQSWVKNMDTGPTGHELVVYGLYSVSGAQACQKAIEQANAASPKMPQLEQAASSYAASLGPLEGTINETNIYYDRENYKDDGFAKGKALHKTLAEQAKVFVAASQRFSATLDDANDALQQAHLQQMEKEGGRNLAYYHLSTMIQAKELVRLLMQNNADPAKIGARIDTFEKTIDDMEKAPGDKPMMWIGYQNDVDNFRKAAKELYRRQRDKTPYNIGEQSLLGGSGGWMVEGSPDKLLNTYNTMVETSNHLGN
ncbi:MAG: YiiG family protein [Burkholderiaceae bacterium]|nr:YiiG family protein [Burkholderiaceae bacterium]